LQDLIHLLFTPTLEKLSCSFSCFGTVFSFPLPLDNAVAYRAVTLNRLSSSGPKEKVTQRLPGIEFGGIESNKKFIYYCQMVSENTERDTQFINWARIF